MNDSEILYDLQITYINGDEKNHCGEILVFYSDINFQK